MGCPHPLSPHSLCCTYGQDAQCPNQPRVWEEGTTAQLEQWATPAGMDKESGGGLVTILPHTVHNGPTLLTYTQWLLGSSPPLQFAAAGSCCAVGSEAGEMTWVTSA